MDFGFTEDKIDETTESKMRRQEGFRDILYEANNFGTPCLSSRSKAALNKARYERILKKREELLALVKKQSILSSVVLKEVSQNR